MEECGEPNPRCLNVAAGLVLFLLAPVCSQGAERWRLQPLPQQKGARLVIHDFKMPSSTRGIAVGCLSQGARCRPTSLVTADGGRFWKFADAASGAPKGFRLRGSA